jgi:hypothetical protein
MPSVLDQTHYIYVCAFLFSIIRVLIFQLYTAIGAFFDNTKVYIYKHLLYMSTGSGT